MTKKKKKNTGLGRGISALIPDFDTPESRSDFLMCSVDDISPNPYQPRTVFNQEELDRLKESIAAQGVLQPLLVRHCHCEMCRKSTLFERFYIDGSFPLIIICGVSVRA